VRAYTSGLDDPLTGAEYDMLPGPSPGSHCGASATGRTAPWRARCPGPRPRNLPRHPARAALRPRRLSHSSSQFGS